MTPTPIGDELRRVVGAEAHASSPMTRHGKRGGEWDAFYALPVRTRRRLIGGRYVRKGEMPPDVLADLIIRAGVADDYNAALAWYYRTALAALDERQRAARADYRARCAAMAAQPSYFYVRNAQAVAAGYGSFYLMRNARELARRERAMPRPNPRATVQAAVESETDKCIVWPHAITDGYGRVVIDGRLRYAHAVVLELAHGPRPTPEHIACHAPITCHNRACINPRHVRWATPTENTADMRVDGTLPMGETHHRAKFTDEQVAAAITLVDAGWTLTAAAASIGMSVGHMSHIYHGHRRIKDQRVKPERYVPQSTIAERRQARQRAHQQQRGVTT